MTLVDPHRTLSDPLPRSGPSAVGGVALDELAEPVPTDVVDLAALADDITGSHRVGRFLDAEGEAELVAAEAAGVPDRLLVHHGRHGTRGRRVVVSTADLRAVEHAASVLEPAGVVLHIAAPRRRGSAEPDGFDPYRAPFVAAVRTAVASVRLSFDGLYLRVRGGATADVLRAARFGVEISAALQEFPGFGVEQLYVRFDAPHDAVPGETESAARREVRLHSAALGAVAPHLLIDPGPAAAAPCHVVVRTAADGVRADAVPGRTGLCAPTRNRVVGVRDGIAVRLLAEIQQHRQAPRCP